MERTNCANLSPIVTLSGQASSPSPAVSYEVQDPGSSNSTLLAQLKANTSVSFIHRNTSH